MAQYLSSNLSNQIQASQNKYEGIVADASLADLKESAVSNKLSENSSMKLLLSEAARQFALDDIQKGLLAGGSNPQALAVELTKKADLEFGAKKPAYQSVYESTVKSVLENSVTTKLLKNLSMAIEKCNDEISHIEETIVQSSKGYEAIAKYLKKAVSKEAEKEAYEEAYSIVASTDAESAVLELDAACNARKESLKEWGANAPEYAKRTLQVLSSAKLMVERVSGFDSALEA